MKKESGVRMRATTGAMAVLIIFGTSVFAQGATQAPAQASASGTEAAKSAPVFKEEELAAILAPIALYPDSVVAQILMASTYPLEVVEASRWVEKNKNLKGEELAKAAKQQPWAESVQAMTALPDVLKMMDEKLDWTQKLGDAYLAQPQDVMAMVQLLRAKAKDEGNLKSDDKMKVSTEAAPAEAASGTTVVEQPAQTIIIESADPEVIYVPSYNPTVIYGTWGYPAYPPYYYYPPGYPAYGWGSGFFWGMTIGISIGWWGGGWDCHPDWHGGDINIGEINIDRGDVNIDRDRVNTGDRKTGDRAGATDRAGSKKFEHDPSHRQGVSYRDQATAQKFDRASGGQVSTRDASRNRASTSTRPSGGGTGGTPSRGGTASTRDLGSTPSRSGGSASSRDVSSGTRTLGTTPTRSSTGTSSTTRSSTPSRSTTSTSSSGSRSSSAFSGSSSGRSASSYGSRGGASRGGGGGRRR